VESEEQRLLLLEYRCTHYQGYLFSRPVPIEQFEALLNQELLSAVHNAY
jgi:EAL domain-containing protein (putative c-di-GMP-specific phosphodiesterase class I)